MNVQLDDALHTELKIRAAMAGVTARKLVTEAIKIRMALTEAKAADFLARLEVRDEQ